MLSYVEHEKGFITSWSECLKVFYLVCHVFTLNNTKWSGLPQPLYKRTEQKSTYMKRYNMYYVYMLYIYL